jgi:molybdate transport system regulatory protein
MKYGTRNQIKAKVKTIKSGEVMSQIKFEVINVDEMASVLTSESVEHLDLKPGDEVQLIVKAINVIPVKE